jgi:hypothetical protein
VPVFASGEVKVGKDNVIASRKVSSRVVIPHGVPPSYHSVPPVTHRLLVRTSTDSSTLVKVHRHLIVMKTSSLHAHTWTRRLTLVFYVAIGSRKKMVNGMDVW